MHIIEYDKLNQELIILRLLFLKWCKRSGSTFVPFCPDCCFNIYKGELTHVRGYYLQIGTWGGHLMWKSNRCYEKENK